MTRISLWFVIASGLLAAACSPKVFSTENSFSGGNTATGGGGGPTTPGSIVCSPLLNELTTSLILNTGDANPTLKSHCVPSGVNHSWSVLRSTTPVTINGLSGDSSTPDFQAAGDGTYFVNLDANAVAMTSFHLTSPLQVIVRNNVPGNPDVTCSPKLNGSLTSYTASSVDPVVSASCVPPGVSYVWTVYKDTTPVTVPGLSGSSSTGQFMSLGEGTYKIWLQASTAGYNSYYSTTPLVVTVPPGATPPHPAHDEFTVSPSSNKVDILFVIDDSSSMLADNQRLASRLQGFVNNLSSAGLDWQACVTLTRAQRVDSTDPNYYWGVSRNWTGLTGSTRHILKAGTANTFQIFTDTINEIGAGWVGTDDERAIKAAWWHLYYGDPRPTTPGAPTGCYRDDASLAVVILSDEDERSIGGDQTQVYYSSESNKLLENDDLPQSYIDFMHVVFGMTKRFTVNSIIVRPGDTTCATAQDAEGSKSHYGVQYNQLSSLTSGHVGSICDADYTTTLSGITTTIAAAQDSVPLQCAPTGAITIDVNPVFAYTSNVNAGRLYFTPSIPVSTTVKLDYMCP